MFWRVLISIGAVSGAASVFLAVSPASAPAPSKGGAYFGLEPPTEKPEVFAPGIVDVPGRSVGHLAFSRDGLECCLTVFESAYRNNHILCTRAQGGSWTAQTPLGILGDRETFEPLFSRDSEQLYFGAPRSTDPGSDKEFWVARRTKGAWADPRPLEAPMNSAGNEFSLAQAADGSFYFGSNREGGLGRLDLYRAVVRQGQPVQVENLGAPVNSPFNDCDPGISPDGRTLVFYSTPPRPGVTHGSDLFISFADGKGGWTTPVPMGDGFNTPADEYAATFSQDGRAFFFARFDGKQGRVYWVSAGALERFRDAASMPAAN